MYDLKKIVKGEAEIVGVKSGGIVSYLIRTKDGEEYGIDIDTTNKEDVGDACVFSAKEKAIMLMRWIRRSIKDNTIIKLK